MKRRVFVTPFDVSIELEEGKTVLDALNDLDVLIEAVCGGKGTCGKCKVIIEDKDTVTQITPIENELLSEKEICQSMRLACLTKIKADTEVFVPEYSLQKELRILEKGISTKVKIDPFIKAYNIQLKKPVLGDHVSFESLLMGSLNTKKLKMDFKVLSDLSRKTKSSDFNVDVYVLNNEIISVLDHNANRGLYGLAMDIGTTTVVIYLMDLSTGKVLDIESTLNPQIKYGEDVISRITYAIQNDLSPVRQALITYINRMINELCNRNHILKHNIHEMTVVGNTAMHHIFLGIDPKSISLSPFTPTVTKSLDVKARDLEIDINPSGNVHLLPVIAGFVGADTMGVILSTELYKDEGISMALDVGTNGEFVLGNKDFMISCSCAAGPAFEGGEITFGMRASPGAIEGMVIDKKTFEPEYHTIKDERPVGLCGSGIVDAIAEMLKVGIIEPSGRIVDNGSDRIRMNVENGQYEYVIEWKENSGIDKDIVITAGDVREVQLAKGALFTGSQLLLNVMDLTVDDIETFYLAGAFGNYIDVNNAIYMGLLPKLPLSKIRSVGNAAGEGAKLSLISRKKRAEENLISRNVKYLELASHSQFQNYFVDALNFPEFICDRK